MVFIGSQPHTMMARSMLYPSSDNCCARAFRAAKSATLRSCWTAGGCAAQYASISAISGSVDVADGGGVLVVTGVFAGAAAVAVPEAVINAGAVVVSGAVAVAEVSLAGVPVCPDVLSGFVTVTIN